MNPFDLNRESTLQYDIDNIYYNVNIKNTTSSLIPATFEETRVEPIVNKARDYEMAVSRFSFDISNVPIFVWPGDLTFSISIEYKGVTSLAPLTFIPNRAINIYGYPAIWNVNDMIKMINTAFANLLITAGLNPLPPAPPVYNMYIQYNQDNPNGNLTIYVQDTLRPLIRLFFNKELYFYLQSIPMFLNNTDLNLIEYAELILEDRFNSVTIGGISYHYYTSEFNVIPSWNGVYSYVFSTTMPVVSENNSGQSNIRQTVVTDFLPAQGNNDLILQYAPSVLRFYSLDEGSKLDRINLTLQWRDINDNLYPIYIDPNKFITVKLLFRKKIANQFEELHDQINGER